MLVIFPDILGKTFLLLALVGMAAWVGQKWMAEDSRDNKFVVAISQEEESKTGSLAVFYLENSESLSGLCRFLSVSREEGLKMLERGEAAALIDCPAGFVEGIMNGTNAPVSLYFKEQAPVAALLCREMASAGGEVLSAAQAEIYAAYDLTEEYGQMAQWDQICQELNLFHIRMLLNREDFFRNETVRTTGETTYEEYYLASGLVFFLLLWGICLQGFWQGASGAVRRQLKQAGIGIWKQTGIILAVTSLAAGTVLFFLLLGIQAASSWGMVPESRILLYWGWETLVYVSSMAVGISSLLIFCSQMAPGGISSGMLIFGVSVILIFISGGFLPSVFLPEPVSRAAEFLPGSWLIRGTIQYLTWDFDHWKLGCLWLFAGVGYVLTCIYGSTAGEGWGRK